MRIDFGFSIVTVVRLGVTALNLPPPKVERGLLEVPEALDIPSFKVTFVGVQVNREIKKIRDKRNFRAHLVREQHIQAFDNKNVGAIHHDMLVGHHVIEQV